MGRIATKGFIVVHEAGAPLWCTFDKSDRVSQALAVEFLARLGHGKKTWNDWQSMGYACVPATVNVEK